jgi:hypothetical protein
LLIEALGVHLVSEADLVLLVLIIGRIGIPPPGRIISVTPSTAESESEAVISEVSGADSQIARKIKVPGIQAAGRKLRTGRAPGE